MNRYNDPVIQSSAILGASFRRLLDGRMPEGDKPESIWVGGGVWVGHFAVIGAHSKVGEDSIIDDFCYVQPNVTIGARTLITHRAQICSGVLIGSDCIIGGFIGDGVRIGDRVRMFGKAIHLQHYPFQPWDAPESEEGAPLLDDDCFVGFDAKIIGPVHIGKGAYVTANAIVTRDVPSQYIATRVNEIIPASEWRGRLANSDPRSLLSRGTPLIPPDQPRIDSQ